ncbi:MAG: amidohydrolase family protein, partial [Pirellulales bacterium]|nr:amidohydrolase family protein [Pirellulales bacterium]
RYVFRVSGPPIEDGIVTVADGRIVSVGHDTDASAVEDLGNVALLPGLINAHTHLEFSDLEQPLGKPRMSLPDWIREVIKYRLSDDRDILAAVEAGLAESTAAGTSAIGEIASSAVPPSAYSNAKTRITAFHELIGLSAERGAQALERAQERLGVASNPRVTDGLSPHAPYSIHRDIVAACAVNQTLPVAMHLAESEEELELLHSGGGPFVELLKDLDAWDATAIRRGTRPLDYLKLLAACDRALVIHGNYLNDEEITFLAANRARMTVVYCPRTHAYFEHPPYPLAKMLAAGVRVALGTDSRASNPDLSVLEEMRFVARMHPDVSPQDIVEMGTLNGATALGYSDMGSLARGNLASLAIVPLRDDSNDDPLSELLHAAR